MSEYTKGKWIKHGLLIATASQYTSAGIVIADCRQDGLNLNEMDANARLICQAPALAEALKNLIDSLRDTHLFASDEVTDALDVLSQIEGKE